MTINDFFQLSHEELISSLEPYQQDIVRELLKNTNNDCLSSVEKYLSASQRYTVRFGGQNHSVVFRDKVLDELEKFLCGTDPVYKPEREKLYQQSGVSVHYILGVLASAIGGQIGVAGTYIAPVIVLLVMSFCKIGVNAWCEMRKEINKKD